jgi:hypothetical protein
MTADVANLLAEIRRSGGDVRLIGCDRLKLVAPKALLPELTDRVRAAKPMLLAALAGTSPKADAAQKGGGGVLNPRRNGATAQHSTAVSSSGRMLLASPADWRSRHGEVAAYRGALHRAEEAAAIAWGEIEHHWHMQHGERLPHWQCAWCREPIGGISSLELADGNRVHFDAAHGLDCLLYFGKRWRAEAIAGLQTLGVDAPLDLKLP